MYLPRFPKKKSPEIRFDPRLTPVELIHERLERSNMEGSVTPILTFSKIWKSFYFVKQKKFLAYCFILFIPDDYMDQKIYFLRECLPPELQNWLLIIYSSKFFILIMRTNLSFGLISEVFPTQCFWGFWKVFPTEWFLGFSLISTIFIQQGRVFLLWCFGLRVTLLNSLEVAMKHNPLYLGVRPLCFPHKDRTAISHEIRVFLILFGFSGQFPCNYSDERFLLRFGFQLFLDQHL